MRNARFCIALCAAGLIVAGSGCGGDSSSEDAAASLRADADAYRLEQDEIAAQAALEDDAGAAAKPEGAPAPTPTAERPKSAPSSALLSAADRESFMALGQQLNGNEGLAVVATGQNQPVFRAGTLQTGVAWSTAKAPVAMAAIAAGVGQQSDLTRAITASDNAAAERLWTALGPDAAAKATAQVRAAGDDNTEIQSERLRGASYTAFGQSQWALTDQARFVAGMACAEAGTQVLGLMQQVAPGQRWGLGTLGGSAAFKGGWGPGINAGQADGWLDRQMGVVSIGGKNVGVAIATTASAHGAGTANLTRLAQWAKSHVNTAGVASSPKC